MILRIKIFSFIKIQTNAVAIIAVYLYRMYRVLKVDYKASYSE